MFIIIFIIITFQETGLGQKCQQLYRLLPPCCFSSFLVILWLYSWLFYLFLESVPLSSPCQNSASSGLFPIWTDFFSFNYRRAKRNLKCSKDNSKKPGQPSWSSCFLHHGCDFFVSQRQRLASGVSL